MDKSPNFSREKLNVIPTTNPACPQCGLIHPRIPAGGVCAIAESKKIEHTNYGKFIAKTTDLLKKDKSGVLLNMLTKTVKAWEIRRNKNGK